MRQLVLVGLTSLFTVAPALGQAGRDWPVYGGDPGGSKYSTLDQITRDNVGRLELVWSWETGDQPVPAARTPFAGDDVTPGKFQGTPLVVNDTMYITTSYTRVVALDAETGEEFWSYDPRVYDWGRQPRGCGFCHRGVAMWTDGSERRIFINTRWRLIALDAASGKPIPSFGEGGEVNLTEDLVWEVNPLHYTNTSPPMVWRDIVITGSGMPDGRIYRRNPPGDIQAFDVRTGKRVWSFHTIPQDGEYGNQTWKGRSWSYTGSTNVWGPFSLDAERGLIYFPVGTPNNDFYGGHRKGDNLFAESVLVLDARTGERVWHFQTVHHGLWDYDLPAPPNLVTINVDGRRIEAVAVVAKTGFTYVFDRVTGEPVWPIEERPVPRSDVPGEMTSATQPFPTKPPPFARQGFSLDDVIDFTPELRAEALKVVEKYRRGPIFTPPSLDGTLLFPGVWGGANWGGAAWDGETGILYVRANNWPHLFKLWRPEPRTHDADYIGGLETLRLENGLPVHKPPYTTLTAIDLNEGELVWQVPLGDSPQIRNHPMLADLDLPPLGKGPPEHGASGPVVTAGGLIFVSGSAPSLYALDKTTGETLWEADLAGGRGYGNPMTFRTRSGRQLIVIAASEPSGANARLLAFGLAGE